MRVKEVRIERIEGEKRTERRNHIHKNGLRSISGYKISN